MKIPVIWKRASLIKNEDIGKVFKIHKGSKDFAVLKVSQAMVGKRFGEFAITRKYNPETYRKK